MGLVARSYRIHLPEHWPLPNDRPLPLLMDYHGWTSNAASHEMDGHNFFQLCGAVVLVKLEKKRPSGRWRTRTRLGVSWWCLRRGWGTWGRVRPTATAGGAGTSPAAGGRWAASARRTGSGSVVVRIAIVQGELAGDRLLQLLPRLRPRHLLRVDLLL
jgi:hypothetical protein